MSEERSINDITNLKEFEELIEKYKSITLEDIKNVVLTKTTDFIIYHLTGYGDGRTCTLCIGAEHVCSQCMWTVITRKWCFEDKNEETYDRLQSNDPNELLLSIEQRVKRMEKVLNKYYKLKLEAEREC